VFVVLNNDLIKWWTLSSWPPQSEEKHPI